MSSFNRSFGGGGGIGGFMAGSPVIRTMLFANVGVFLFEMLFGSLRIAGVPIEAYIQHYLYLWPTQSGNFYLWQPFTYMFLHGGFGHIFFNMFALVIFGPALEAAWGYRKTMTYYILCGLGGGVAHIIISPMIGGAAPLLGASGAIFGLLAAFGLMYPEQPLYIYFLIPVKAKYAVLGFILLEVFTVSSNDGIGHLAHLGGAVVGIIYLLIDGYKPSFIKRSRSSSSPGMGAWQSPRTPFGGGGGGRRRINDDDETLEAEYEEIGSTRMKGSSNATSTMGRVITQEDIDRILDKIAASGYQNLTEDERQILFEASKKMEGRG